MLDPKNLKRGEEQYEEYCTVDTKDCRVQYDYRHIDGELFSCTATTLAKCRELKNKWLEEKGL
jgi:hypothetical protein